MCFKINHAIIIIQYLFGFTFFCKFYCSCFVMFNQLLNVRLSDLYECDRCMCTNTANNIRP